MKAFFSWSGGKDSMLALDRALHAGMPVAALLCMLDEDGSRSRSHGLAPALLRAQAEALGLPLVTARASWNDYENIFVRQLQTFAARGFTHGLFGDIDLQAHRDWEEQVCAAAGLQAHLPLWGEPRRALVDEFFGRGYRARVVCVDRRHLDGSYCGREFDAAFVASLPEGVDACGENGEFHTFVHDGPRFRQPVAHELLALHEVPPAFPGSAGHVVAELG